SAKRRRCGPTDATAVVGPTVLWHVHHTAGPGLRRRLAGHRLHLTPATAVPPGQHLGSGGVGGGRRRPMGPPLVVRRRRRRRRRAVGRPPGRRRTRHVARRAWLSDRPGRRSTGPGGALLRRPSRGR